MQNLRVKKYLKVIFCEYTEGFGKKCGRYIYIYMSQTSLINLLNMSGCINYQFRVFHGSKTSRNMVGRNMDANLASHISSKISSKSGLLSPAMPVYWVPLADYLVLSILKTFCIPYHGQTEVPFFIKNP
jgi:hypothetical protein